ncbi:NERD domain-containing protein [Aquipuribacter sp. MA13-6]|uniref:NERD domain-containing protein n=1 Tax=unclassified Aquipuribacter TaxID=2635084 RepID=UPI003EE89A87
MAATTAPVQGPATGRGPLLRRRVVTGLVVTPRRPQPSATPCSGPCRHEDRRCGSDLSARVPGELVARELARHHDASAQGPGGLVVRAPRAAALRRWYRAVAAQQRVAALLGGLDARSHVLHAVPVGGPLGVDHLVVGPNGVVVVRTAHHAGERVSVHACQVRADGRPVGHVREVERQVRLVAATLGAAAGHDVAVRGVVVLVGARSVRATEVPRRVTVLTDDDLVTWLVRRPRVVSQVVVDRIAALAADPRTWGLDPGTDDDAGRRHGQACVEAVRVALSRWPRPSTAAPGRRAGPPGR